MAAEEKKKVLMSNSPRRLPSHWKSPVPGPAAVNQGGKVIVSKLVTRLPRNTWRMQSRGMTLHHEVDRFARTTKENFITLVITVVGMATALTWNEVVRAIIDTFFANRSAIYAKVYVAVIATIFTLVVTYMISRVRESGQK